MLRPAQGEIHSVEPAFHLHSQSSNPATDNLVVDDKLLPKPSDPGKMQPSAIHDKSPGKSTGDQNSAGLGTSAGNRRRLLTDEIPGFNARDIIHVAYRHADRGLVELRRRRPLQQQTPTPGEGAWNGVSTSPLPVAANEAEAWRPGRGLRSYEERGARLGSRTRLREEEHTVRKVEEKDKRKEQLNVKHEGQRSGDLDEPSLLQSESPEEPAVAGWGRGGGPFGAALECPSTPRVLQIGIAMDAGMFKVWPLVCFAEHGKPRDVMEE